MARKDETKSRGLGRLRRAAEAVKRVFTRGRSEGESAEPAIAEAPVERVAPPRVSRPVQRQSDIPMDVLDRTYTPPVTSSKASFRSDGLDHHLDQEFGRGIADERWNDEDHFTNKSGDPRIGTHGRTQQQADEDRA